MNPENCYDLIVAGGGPAGVAAAVAAAELGAKTLLVEDSCMADVFPTAPAS